MHTFSFSLYIISNLLKCHKNSHFVFTWTQIVNIFHLSFAFFPPVTLSLHTVSQLCPLGKIRNSDNPVAMSPRHLCHHFILKEKGL